VKQSIFVYGSSGHAKVIIDILEKQGEFKIEGLIDDFKTPGTSIFGYNVIGAGSQIFSSKLEHIFGGIIAIGDNWDRSMIVNKIIQLKPDFKFITAIHPSAMIARGIIIGDGTVVMAGAIINSDTTIGEHCIINTKASLDHDNHLGNFVSIAPGVTMGGDVAVGDYSALSIGATVIQKIDIGVHCVVGAGSVVVKNVDSQTVQYGVPAKFIRKREIGERYL
jgi:sugar O-acyltransferase (sialic acid O-acetyltransferase NeuD family)